MDGYALRAEDTRGASAEKPNIIEIIEDIPASHLPGRDHPACRSGDARLPRTLLHLLPPETAGRHRRDGRAGFRHPEVDGPGQRPDHPSGGGHSSPERFSSWTTLWRGCRRRDFNRSSVAIRIVLLIHWKCQGHWWASRTSNPEWGASTLPGGFDSHALPPIISFICGCFRATGRRYPGFRAA
jgi:hypothetical protein